MNNTQMSNSLIYAAGYYPLMHEKEDWERDLKSMKDAGITLIRTAELFNTWDRIEPECGVFEFEFLDEFFDLCTKYDIKILLGTGTASPPYWLHEKYPDVNILNNHNEQYPNNVSYTWACFDNPGYLEESERYTNRSNKEIDAHYLDNDDNGLLIITNYVTKKHGGFFVNSKKKVRISVDADRHYEKAINLETKEEIELQQKSGKTFFETTVIKNQTMILKLI